MDFLTEFPSMERQALRDLKKAIDGGFRDFSREFGEAIENFFEPLLWFLVWFEKLLRATPWPLIILAIAVLAWLGSRSKAVVVGCVLSFLAIGYFGMWIDTMSTLAIISVATMLCIAVGIPPWHPHGALGPYPDRNHSDSRHHADDPRVPCISSPSSCCSESARYRASSPVCIYALPPIVRLTNLGIRLVEKEALEAADAFGARLPAEAVRGTDPARAAEHLRRG